MVHRGSVHRPQGHDNDGAGSGVDPEEATERGTDGGGQLQRRHRSTGGGLEGGGHCDGASNGRAGGHGAALLAARETMVSGPADVADDKEGTGGALIDGLHPGEGPPSLQEYHRPGPSAQLGPLHGPGLSDKCTPVGDETLPGRAEAVAGEAAGKTNEDG